MDSEVVEFETGSRRFSDLTDTIRRYCANRADGLCLVFVPHATAGLALIELGSGSEDDLDRLLDRLVPRDDRELHGVGE